MANPLKQVVMFATTSFVPRRALTYLTEYKLATDRHIFPSLPCSR